MSEEKVKERERFLINLETEFVNLIEKEICGNLRKGNPTCNCRLRGEIDHRLDELFASLEDTCMI